MKTTFYLLLITAVVGLTAASLINPENEKHNLKEQQRSDSTRISKSEKSTDTIQSIWLNKLYFPQIQEIGCPFYLKPVKPGC